MHVVTLVPAPMNCLQAFVLFLMVRSGKMQVDSPIRFVISEEVAKEQLGDGLIQDLRLTLDKLEALAYDLVPIAMAEDKFQQALARRLISYCRSGDNQHGHVLKRFLNQILARHFHDPAEVVTEMSWFFEQVFRLNTDPWKIPFADHLPVFSYPLPIRTVVPTDRLLVSLPVFKEGSDRRRADEDIIRQTTKELSEGNILKLLGERLAVVIGGAPGSGKSTFTASLVAEVQNIVQSLRTRSSWNDFDLSVSSVTLDLATPTLAEIQGHAGKDKAVLDAQKRPWTRELAVEAAHHLAQAKQTANLVFADLPGKVTSCTEIASAHADAAIIVTRDWEQCMPVWAAHFQRMGVPVITRARSRSSEDGFPSVVTTHRPGKHLSGRVVGLDRMQRSWDRFVSWTARFLLFDLLPGLIDKRDKRLNEARRF